MDGSFPYILHSKACKIYGEATCIVFSLLHITHYLSKLNLIMNVINLQENKASSDERIKMMRGHISPTVTEVRQQKE